MISWISQVHSHLGKARQLTAACFWGILTVDCCLFLRHTGKQSLITCGDVPDLLWPALVKKKKISEGTTHSITPSAGGALDRFNTCIHPSGDRGSSASFLVKDSNCLLSHFLEFMGLLWSDIHFTLAMFSLIAKVHRIQNTESLLSMSNIEIYLTTA